MLDRSFWDVRSRGAGGSVVPESHRPLDLAAFDLEESSRIDLYAVIDLPDRIAEFEAVADAQTLGLIRVADETLAASDEQSELGRLCERRHRRDHKKCQQRCGFPH